MLAHKLGCGPLALRHRLEGPLGLLMRINWEKNRKVVVTKLVKYIRYVHVWYLVPITDSGVLGKSTGAPTTRIQAMELVCDLVVTDPALHDEFLHSGLHVILNILEHSQIPESFLGFLTRPC